MNLTPFLSFARLASDETRLRLMALLCCQERSVGELAKLLGVTQPTISHHLATLLEGRHVRVRQEGKYSYYTLNQELILECCEKLVTFFSKTVEPRRLTMPK